MLAHHTFHEGVCFHYNPICVLFAFLLFCFVLFSFLFLVRLFSCALGYHVIIIPVQVCK